MRNKSESHQEQPLREFHLASHMRLPCRRPAEGHGISICIAGLASTFRHGFPTPCAPCGRSEAGNDGRVFLVLANRQRWRLTEARWPRRHQHLRHSRPRRERSDRRVSGIHAGTWKLSRRCRKRCLSSRRSCGPLYLHFDDFVRWKRLSSGLGGHPCRSLAVSPVAPAATTVDELGISASVTRDRIVAWLQSHAQGRLP